MGMFSIRMGMFRSRTLRAFAAVVLTGSLALWHPSMMACMGAMQGMDPTMHHHGSPQRAVTNDCCGMCACTVATTLPTASVALLRGPAKVYPAADRARSMPAAATPYALPFATGPPLHLA